MGRYVDRVIYLVREWLGYLKYGCVRRHLALLVFYATFAVAVEYLQNYNLAVFKYSLTGTTPWRRFALPDVQGITTIQLGLLSISVLGASWIFVLTEMTKLVGWTSIHWEIATITAGIGITQAFCVSLATVGMLKLLVQYPRPDFLARCFDLHTVGDIQNKITQLQNQSNALLTQCPTGSRTYITELQSFPSRHAATGASLFLFMTAAIARHIPSNPKRAFFILLCVGDSLFCSWSRQFCAHFSSVLQVFMMILWGGSRLTMNRHHFLDVLIGWGIGSCLAWLSGLQVWTDFSPTLTCEMNLPIKLRERKTFFDLDTSPTGAGTAMITATSHEDSSSPPVPEENATFHNMSIQNSAQNAGAQNDATRNVQTTGI